MVNCPVCPVCAHEDVAIIEEALSFRSNHDIAERYGWLPRDLIRHQLHCPRVGRGKVRTRILAVDLAEAPDWTAAAGLDANMDTIDVALLDRWQNLPYVAPDGEESTVRRVCGLVSRTQPHLVVLDATGVGRPVVQAVRVALGSSWARRVVAVTITTGDPTGGRLNRSVGKQRLVAGMQIAYQNKRIRAKRSLPLGDVLMAELAGFRQEKTKGGTVRYGNDVGEVEWRTAKNDDLVLALALGVHMAPEAITGRMRASGMDSWAAANLALRKTDGWGSGHQEPGVWW